MRSFVLISSFVTLFSALCVNAAVVGGKASVGRFNVKGTHVAATDLTEAELHARSLTHQPPTRRSTAQRRQVSDLPEVIAQITVGATNLATGSLLGDLAIGASLGLEVTVDTPTTLTTSYSPTWSTVADQRVNITGLVDFPLLGLVQESLTSGIDLGVGLSAGVILTGVADPGTTPGCTPVTEVANYITGDVGLAVETDVWLIDYVAGAITPQWTNSDGSLPTTILVTDGIKIAATGDVGAFNAAHGGAWFPILSLALTVAAQL